MARGDPSDPAPTPDKIITGRGPSARPVPFWGFILALIVFGVVMFAVPDKARPWLALLVILGAVVAQGGAAPVEELRRKAFGQ